MARSEHTGDRGRCHQRCGAGLTLAVRRVERRDGNEEFWKGENVTIPPASIAMFTERRLSRSRTTLFSAGVAVAALVLGQAFAEGGGIFGRGGQGPGRREVRPTGASIDDGARENVCQRIDDPAVDVDFVMKVRPSRDPAVADRGDHFAARHSLALANQYA